MSDDIRSLLMRRFGAVKVFEYLHVKWNDESSPVPKSRVKRKKKAGARDIPWGGKSGPGDQRINLVLAVLLLCTVVVGGVYWFVYPG